MKRYDWLTSKKQPINFCEECGKYAGEIDGLCIVCKKAKMEAATNRSNLIASQLANPIRHNLDYQGVFRNAIRIEPMRD